MPGPYSATEASGGAHPDPRIEAIQCHDCGDLVPFDSNGYLRFDRVSIGERVDIVMDDLRICTSEKCIGNAVTRIVSAAKTASQNVRELPGLNPTGR